MSDTGRRLASRLRIERFAQIENVDLRFGDLTLLVGAQGTGKSIALQWLKAALDGKQLVKALKEAGHTLTDAETVVDLVFGDGMGKGWSGDTSVRLDGSSITPQSLGRRGTDTGRAFFIPAQRSMLISDGWASPFQKLSEEVPVVARIFSQTLFDLFSKRGDEVLFPADRRLKKEVRDQIDRAVFHSGEVSIETDRLAKRLRLTHGSMQLPYMTWTAGQREFTPLLLGLYHLLPQRGQAKREDIDWVVIEEPEMGLHPEAVSVVVLLLLDLLWRGYRVVVATHSSDLLNAVWMLQELKGNDAHWKLVCEGLGLPTAGQLRNVAKAALEKSYRVNLLAFESDGRVGSTDISSLDPDSENERISGWGGLAGVASTMNEAVFRAVQARAG